MRCLYCGKEIGAFRLLRDREFCGALHRRKYGERLGKALHEIAVPEPAPAGVAGFLPQMPLQPGKFTSTLVLRQAAASRNRIRTGFAWPLTIDHSDTTSDTTSEPASVPEPVCLGYPPRCERWMPALPAEPAAAFVQSSAALNVALVLDRALATPPVCSLRIPAQFIAALEPLEGPHPPCEAPPTCQQWMSAPAADPVLSCMRVSDAPAAAVPVALRTPGFALSAAAPDVPGIARSRRMPHAEPVMAAARPRTANAAVVPIRQESEMALPAGFQRRAGSCGIVTGCHAGWPRIHSARTRVQRGAHHSAGCF